MKDYKKNKLHLINDQMTDSVALVWPNQNMRIKHYNFLEDLYCKLLVTLLNNKTKVFLFSNKSFYEKVEQIKKEYDSKYINHLEFNSDDIWVRDYCPIQTFNPSSIMFFADSGVKETLFSNVVFSLIEPTIIINNF